jgi:hypothetical protein
MNGDKINQINNYSSDSNSTSSNDSMSKKRRGPKVKLTIEQRLENKRRAARDYETAKRNTPEYLNNKIRIMEARIKSAKSDMLNTRIAINTL